MAATDTVLGELHSQVAKTLIAQVEHQEEEVTWDDGGNEVRTGKMKYTAAPATLAAAIKFLKDNNVTCDIEGNTDINDLKSALERKQLRSERPSPQEAARLHAVT